MHLAARLSAKALAVSAALLLVACEEKPPEPAPVKPQAAQPLPAPLNPHTLNQLQTFQQAANELMVATIVCTDSLNTLGQQFLDQVSPENFELVKNQWQGCLEIYQASRALIGFTPAHQAALDKAHSNLGNALQMPGFIDSVEGYPFSGIVNDASLPLSTKNLREQHGLTDESDVSIGIYVIGFLLNGENNTRPPSDFEAQKTWNDSRTDLPISEHSNNRRRKLLQLTLAMATQDSKALQHAWMQGEPPTTERAATQWEQRQQTALLENLEQHPNNQALANQIDVWLSEGIIPGAENDEPVLNSLKQKLAENTAEPAS